MAAVHILSRQELLALAALLRTMVLADKVVGGAELDALDRVGDKIALGSPSAATREDVRALGSIEFRQIFGEASVALPTIEAVRAAAEAITRPAAREVLYSQVLDVAAADGIAEAERELLDWLEELWSLGQRSA